MSNGGPVVSFAARVPETPSVVVRTTSGTKALYAVMLACAVLQCTLIAALPVLVFWLGSQAVLLLGLIPLLLLQLWFVVIVVREYQGLLGPQLAADHTGLWVRTGFGSRPEVVYLPWSAVDGIDTARRGTVVRIMSRDGERLLGTRAHLRARSVRRRFGTAFVVDGKRSIESAERIVQRLHQTAGTGRIPRPSRRPS